MGAQKKLYSYHHPNTEVRQSAATGLGLFATGPIAAGELLVITGGLVLPFESLESHELPGHPIQIEKDWVLSPFDTQKLDGIFVVNHSCVPNAGMRGQLGLVALRSIEEGEEIRFDYCMTDSDPDGRETFAMECHCQEPGCRGRITDLDWRREDLQRRYRGYFAAYLDERIARGD